MEPRAPWERGGSPWERGGAPRAQRESQRKSQREWQRGNQYERGDEAQTRRARRAPEGSAAEVCGCAEAIAPRPPLQPHTDCGAHATACARQSGRRTARVGRAAFARPTCAVLTLRVRTRARSANPHQHTPATNAPPQPPQTPTNTNPRNQRKTAGHGGKSCARRDSNPQPSDP